MSKTAGSYRGFLKEELARRLEKNSAYSIRAFAKSLGTPSGPLSEVLSGKRIPSYKFAQKIVARLGLSPAQEQAFLSSLAEAHQKRGLQRMSPVFRKFKEPLPSTKVQELSIELFRVIGDWYHYAILVLTELKHYESDPKWIAAQLGISRAEAKLAIDRLLELKMLRWEGDRLVRWSNEIATTADKHLTTPALRRHQKQILEKAIHSLENDPIEVRSMTSMTMAVDERKLGEARKLIEKFTVELNQLLESGPKTRVYELGISLYPLQKQKGANS